MKKVTLPEKLELGHQSMASSRSTCAFAQDVFSAQALLWDLSEDDVLIKVMTAYLASNAPRESKDSLSTLSQLPSPSELLGPYLTKLITSFLTSGSASEKKGLLRWVCFTGSAFRRHDAAWSSNTATSHIWFIISAFRNCILTWSTIHIACKLTARSPGIPIAKNLQLLGLVLFPSNMGAEVEFGNTIHLAYFAPKGRYRICSGYLNGL